MSEGSEGRLDGADRPGGSGGPGGAADAGRVAETVARLVCSLFPGATVSEVRRLAPDDAGVSAERGTGKASGYGAPLRVSLVDGAGASRCIVFRTATPNDFGHDRRSDRAAEQVLSFDTFNTVPRHVRAIDIGVVAGERLVSLRDGDEFYLVTDYAPGRLYAEDLRRVARTGEATPRDLDRAAALARYLVALHALPGSHAGAWTRAIRDLVGHGEGIFGMVDGYPADTPGAPRALLDEIERLAVEWRQRLRGRTDRLRRTHGDFHPFNIVFDDGPGPGDGDGFTLLDTSRGSEGDPADDVTCLALNYVFFSVERPASWARGLGPLWRRFWEVYLDRGDRGVLDVAAPFWAWRSLVVASPAFYPSLSASSRSRILGLARAILAAPRLDLDAVEATVR